VTTAGLTEPPRDDPGEIAARAAAMMGVSAATARRNMRGSVVLPDGRIIRVAKPGMAGVTLEEHRLRDALARQLGGITEACLPYGRADVMTGAAVFEVETAPKWRTGARQVLAYSAQCGLPPALALFGPIHRDDLLRFYVKLRDSRPPLALWWWNGGRWDQINSRRVCRNMPMRTSS
jgi:hypothetical protein